MEFTDREFQIIQDHEFLLTKAGASAKIHELLSEVKSALKSIIQESWKNHEMLRKCSVEKISKGENYRGLPYQVLDFPATFSKNDIFAFRTMFWWGNHFSCTLHLQGEPLDIYRQKLISSIERFVGRDTLICINQSPWEYHFESDNYRLLSLDDVEFIQKCSFLKLSKRVKLNCWKQLPIEATKYLSLLLGVLSSGEQN